jgi:hypothetical protein
LQVAEAREAYQEARKELLAVLERGEGKKLTLESRRRAMLELNRLDERVQLNQLFSTNPDAEEALQDIRDTNLFTRSVSEFAKNRGQYLGYGMVGRMAAAAVIGAIALPPAAAIAGGGAAAVGVAMFTGYLRAKRDARELLKTRRASGVIGEADLEEDVLYTANNEEILARKEAERDEAMRAHDEKRTALLNADISTLREKVKSGHIIEHRTKKLREFRDAQFYTDRVERLLAKLDIAHEMGDKASAEMLERKIAQTATLMRGLLKQGMLSFGQESRLTRMQARAEDKHPVARPDDARSAINSLAFMQALGHADAAQALDMFALESKIDTVLGGYRETIDASARKRSDKQIAKAVKMSAGFALAGFGLAHAGLDFFGAHHGHEVGTGAAVHHGNEIASPAQPHAPSWAVGRHGAAISPTTPPHAPSWAMGNHGIPGIHHGSLEQVALGSHAVAHGETLTAIVRKFPEIAKLPAHDQEIAIANLMRHMSPEQLKLAGISSGNANLIRVGEHINLDKLHEHLSVVKSSGHVTAEHAPMHTAHNAPHQTHTTNIQNEEAVAPVNIETHTESHPVEHFRGFRKSILPPLRAQHHWVPPSEAIRQAAQAHEAVPEVAALAQNKMHKMIEDIFGQKGVFGRDHTREWEGDPMHHASGLKDAPAENMLSRHVGLLPESSTRAGLRDYMRSLFERSGVRPRIGETSEMYIRRALIAEEVAAQKLTAAQHVATESVIPPPFIAHGHLAHAGTHASEAANVAESVHSTDEALGQLMPKLLKKFPELGKGDEGVRANVLANFLRTAKPEHFKALGVNGADMEKFVGGGKVDAAKLMEYFHAHHQGGAALHEAAAAPIHSANEGIHMPALSHENVVAMEKNWDMLSEANKVEAAERMVPDYIKQGVVGEVKGIDFNKFMQHLEKIPARSLFAEKASLLHDMDGETAEGVRALGHIAAAKHLTDTGGEINWDRSLADFIQEAYARKLIAEGPAAVK